MHPLRTSTVQVPKLFVGSIFVLQNRLMDEGLYPINFGSRTVMTTFCYPPYKAIWNIKESNSTVSSSMTFMQAIKARLKG